MKVYHYRKIYTESKAASFDSASYISSCKLSQIIASRVLHGDYTHHLVNIRMKNLEGIWINDIPYLVISIYISNTKIKNMS